MYRSPKKTYDWIEWRVPRNRIKIDDPRPLVGLSVFIHGFIIIPRNIHMNQICTGWAPSSNVNVGLESP